MKQVFSNNARTTVAATLSAAGETLTVSDGSKFPTLAANEYFLATLFRVVAGVESGHEVVKCTARSGNSLTIQRSYEGAAASEFAAGSIVALRPTAKMMEYLRDEHMIAAVEAIVNANTVVDVSIYDTAKDSDGGQWRYRTSHTSWYNETLNTATRGATKEFPAVALIVAEAAKVTIYDMTDSAVPMWMVFNRATSNHLWTTGNMTSVAAKNGQIQIGNILSGVFDLQFIKDRSILFATVASRVFSQPISGRNSGTNTLITIGSGDDIVNTVVNDVAITVLDNAPIDSETGLPIPTIAVATDGGVSVIKDDGTVVDITGFSGSVLSIVFASDNQIITSRDTSYQMGLFNIPTSDTTVASSVLESFYDTAQPAVAAGDIKILGAATAKIFNHLSVAGSLGLSQLSEYDSSNGMVAYTTSSYCSGWMQGDIKGAWLADTDATNVTGSELVTNGTFDTNTTGWTASSSTLSISTQRLRVTNSASASGYAEQVVATEIGKTYTLSADYVSGTATQGRLILSTTSGGTNIATEILSTSGTYSITFTATTTATYILVQIYQATVGVYSDWDNVSIRLADSDRSVNNNGLQVYGTITKTAVATGAELVAYSGFSVSNYLYQPYNPDMNYGTGAFYIRGWVNLTSNATALLIDRGDATQERIAITNISGSGLSFQVRDSAGTASSVSMATNLPLSVWKMFTAVRDSSGTLMSIYLDDELEVSASVTARNVDSTDQGFTIGAANIDKTLSLSGGSLVFMQTGAGAPTAEQIKEIYESERHLFQDNAKCTLDGTSDAVQALAYDEDTGLLHASTSQYRSAFKGLQRVESEAGNFTSLSADSGMVATGA